MKKFSESLSPVFFFVSVWLICSKLSQQVYSLVSLNRARTRNARRPFCNFRNLYFRLKQNAFLRAVPKKKTHETLSRISFSQRKQKNWHILVLMTVGVVKCHTTPFRQQLLKLLSPTCTKIKKHVQHSKANTKLSWCHGLKPTRSQPFWIQT